MRGEFWGGCEGLIYGLFEEEGLEFWLGVDMDWIIGCLVAFMEVVGWIMCWFVV